MEPHVYTQIIKATVHKCYIATACSHKWYLILLHPESQELGSLCVQKTNYQLFDWAA